MKIPQKEIVRKVSKWLRGIVGLGQETTGSTQHLTVFHLHEAGGYSGFPEGVFAPSSHM